jgi:uncharacterized protein YpiB (UPF0302 family)
MTEQAHDEYAQGVALYKSLLNSQEEAINQQQDFFTQDTINLKELGRALMWAAVLQFLHKKILSRANEALQLLQEKMLLQFSSRLNQ